MLWGIGIEIWLENRHVLPVGNKNYAAKIMGIETLWWVGESIYHFKADLWKLVGLKIGLVKHRGSVKYHFDADL